VCVRRAGWGGGGGGGWERRGVDSAALGTGERCLPRCCSVGGTSNAAGVTAARPRCSRELPTTPHGAGWMQCAARVDLAAARSRRDAGRASVNGQWSVVRLGNALRAAVSPNREWRIARVSPEPKGITSPLRCRNEVFPRHAGTFAFSTHSATPVPGSLKRAKNSHSKNTHRCIFICPFGLSPSSPSHMIRYQWMDSY
jgi:hypothetical protein